jgi:hypothetical protein
MTYTTLRDFLDRYTNDRGEIQGDPATIAAEAVGAGLVSPDDEYKRQFEEEEGRA